MLRCIAIDDEPMALTVIERYCERVGGVELQVFTNPVEGMKCVKETLPDLLLLDIEMGGVNGVELAREIPAKVGLIFTTAYAQFAIDGFDLNAVDYLHKPFSYVRFERAIRRGEERIASARSTEEGESITIKVEYQNVRLALADIEYVEAMDNYVKIYCGTARPILSQMSMKVIGEMLPNENFVRVHKSYIVARRAIATYNRSQLQILHREVVVPIGRTYQAEFLEWI